jgi:hypothetical protein
LFEGLDFFSYNSFGYLSEFLSTVIIIKLTWNKIMTVTIPFFGSAESLIEKLKNAGNGIEDNFTGDYNRGQIKILTGLGEVHGTYKIDDNIFTIEILKKPQFLSEVMIKEEIIKLL